MSEEAVGEVIGGELAYLLVGLYREKKDKVNMGDFVVVRSRSGDVVGIVCYLKFHSFIPPRPLGIKPEERRAVLPDVEDTIYVNSMCIAEVLTVGFTRDSEVHHGIPPFLPDIHDPVYIMDENALRRFHLVNGSLRLSYLSRFIEEEIKYKPRVLAMLYRKINRHLNISLNEFLGELNRLSEELKGESASYSLVSLLTRELR